MLRPRIYEAGTILRVLQSRGELDDGQCDAVYAGQIFRVDDYAPVNSDPDMYSDIYYGNSNDSTIMVERTNTELVMTREDANKRVVPSKQEVLNALDLLSVDFGANFEVNMSNVNSDGTAEVHGVTSEGLRFMYEISVTAIEATDW